MAKVLLVVNSSWNVFNFRMTLLERIKSSGGNTTIVAAPLDDYSNRLKSQFYPISMASRSLNPFVDFLTFIQLFFCFVKIKPDVVLLYTAKPNIYGNFAARILGLKTISNVAGLGSGFSRGGFLAYFLKFLYRLSLRRSKTVFFQNRDDFEEFVREGIVAEENAVVIPGSGVDLNRFSPEKKVDKTSGEPFVFLLSARLLWDKGIKEFVEAAERLLDDGFDARFRLMGFLDVDNSKAITKADIDEMTSRYGIDYVGVSDSVENVLRNVDCVVMPSYYREGTPRSLLEAAAMGIPVITTDMPGCRDVVDNGVTGLLCKPRNVGDLYSKMKFMFSLSAEEREAMGRRARVKMESEYDESIVIDHYLEAINRIEVSRM